MQWWSEGDLELSRRVRIRLKFESGVAFIVDHCATLETKERQIVYQGNGDGAQVSEAIVAVRGKGGCALFGMAKQRD